MILNDTEHTAASLALQRYGMATGVRGFTQMAAVACGADLEVVGRFSARLGLKRVVSNVVPTQSALVCNTQRRIVEISAHQRW
jgi:hypothetical protein